MVPGKLLILKDSTKMKLTFVYFLFSVALLAGITGCHRSAPSSPKAAQKNDKKAGPKIVQLPEVPELLTSEKDRAAYLAAHYWDLYNFKDTVILYNYERIEDAYANFLQLLPHIPFGQAKAALTRLMDAATANKTVFRFFIDLSQKYLYDPNSPYQNEAFYIPVLRYLIASPELRDIYKTRYRYQLKMALKNQPGNTAADFVYTLKSGEKQKMSAIRAAYTLLFFNNPDCHDCREVKDYMSTSAVINKFVKQKTGGIVKLAVLAVYIDQDLAIWEKAAYPGFMINCYDAGQVIQKKELYNLKAIPTMYLLDKNKKVILKDVPVKAIEAYLASMAQ